MQLQQQKPPSAATAFPIDHANKDSLRAARMSLKLIINAEDHVQVTCSVKIDRLTCRVWLIDEEAAFNHTTPCYKAGDRDWSDQLGRFRAQARGGEAAKGGKWSERYQVCATFPSVLGI